MALNPIFPVANYLTITQGYKSTHVGNDYGWTSRVSGGCNQPIVAVEAGTVITAVDGYGNTYPNSRIYGNYVVISHGGGVYSLYGHLLKGISVKKGQSVSKGQTVGYMGNSGYSKGQHLHFEYRVGGNSKSYAKDPLKYLALEGDTPIISDATLYKDRITKRAKTTATGTPVKRDTTVDQIEVLISNLNGRAGAGTNNESKGFVTKGIYNILKEQQGGNYKWYEIEDGLWIAYSKNWETLYPKEVQVKLYNCAINGVSEGDKNQVVALGEKIGVPAVVTEVK